MGTSKRICGQNRNNFKLVGVEVFSDVTREDWKRCRARLESLRKEDFD
jgi:hypothetical protein